MPAFDELVENLPPEIWEQPLNFPPVLKQQILNCSVDSWYRKYRQHCMHSVILPLPNSILEYLGESGIILADDTKCANEEDDEEWTAPITTNTSPLHEYEDSDSDELLETTPPNHRFPEFHQRLKDVIAELGGAVFPKLNWSAPQDATHMMTEKTMRCIQPNDIYLLLKSSNLITHDLDHAFDGCQDKATSSANFTPILTLRPWLNIKPSLEFRCFVKQRTLIGISQRDRNHYSWLSAMRPVIAAKVEDFFERVMRTSFPDSSFVFDVYIPEDSTFRHNLGAVQLIDINPWAPKTGSLLFSWNELLTMEVPGMLLGDISVASSEDDSTTTDDDCEDVVDFVPEMRIVEKGANPEMMTTEFSAHKLPLEVVEAGRDGPRGMAHFMGQWQQMIFN